LRQHGKEAFKRLLAVEHSSMVRWVVLEGLLVVKAVLVGAARV
jgi:hypothetical protein